MTLAAGWMIGLGCALLLIAWGLVAIAWFALGRLAGQLPSLRREEELQGTVADLERRRQDALAAVKSAADAEAAAVAAQRGGERDLAALESELGALRREKRELVDRVKQIKDEEHRSREAAAANEQAKSEANAEARRLRHDLAVLEPQIRDAETHLGQLRREAADEERHVNEIRRQRQSAAVEAAHKAETLATDSARLEAAIEQKRQALAELNRAIAEAKSKLARYQDRR